MCKKIIFTLALLFITSGVHASELKMIFWYPGEAGSTTEGQPVLDAFFDYINKKIAPSKISGQYFNTADGGLAYINKQKPAFGIVSYSAWEMNKSKLANASVWLATNPLPHGKNQEQYILVGKSLSPPPLPSAENAKGESPVFSSEPLSRDFISNILGLTGAQKMTPTQTQQILFKLRSIAEGTTAGAAILTSNEGTTLAKMTAPWTKSLTTIQQSKPVPTARLVLFGAPPKDTDKIRQVLLGMRTDPEAKEVLEEMRLAGFSEP